jgi:hypothetical protein
MIRQKIRETLGYFTTITTLGITYHSYIKLMTDEKLNVQKIESKIERISEGVNNTEKLLDAENKLRKLNEVKVSVDKDLLDLQNNLKYYEDKFNLSKNKLEELKSIDPSTLSSYEENLKFWSDNYKECQNKLNEVSNMTGKKTIEILNYNIDKIDNIFKNQFIDDYYLNLQNFLDSLNVLQTGAFLHLICNFIVLYALYNIGTILFGNFLITYFFLENKYPRIAKYLKYRAKLQKYSIIFNTIFIIIGFIFPIHVDTCILFNIELGKFN